MKPLAVGLRICSGWTVFAKLGMTKIWPNIPWLSVHIISHLFVRDINQDIKQDRELTAIDQSSERRKDRDCKDIAVLKETLDSRRTGKLGTALREGLNLFSTTCCDHFGDIRLCGSQASNRVLPS